MASKTIVNNSEFELTVVLYAREGSNAEPSRPYSILPHETKSLSYGQYDNTLLKGIEFSWGDNGAVLTKKEMINTINLWLDELLNTNDIITINAVGRADLTGSN